MICVYAHGNHIGSFLPNCGNFTVCSFCFREILAHLALFNEL